MVFFGGRGRDLLDAANATEGRLYGNAGDDILTEAGGGGYGTSFTGGPGRDLMVGSYGDRVLDLTGEGDTVLGDGVTVSYGHAPSGVRVSLRRERGYRIDGSGVVDRIIGALNVYGSPFDDVLIGYESAPSTSMPGGRAMTGCSGWPALTCCPETTVTTG